MVPLFYVKGAAIQFIKKVCSKLKFPGIMKSFMNWHVRFVKTLAYHL